MLHVPKLLQTNLASADKMLLGGLVYLAWLHIILQFRWRDSEPAVVIVTAGFLLILA